MRLSLENGYPYPLPDGFDSDTYDSRSHSVLIEDVCHFEWRHTLTIEFDTVEACERIEQLSGCWTPWSHKVLEAVIDVNDGYEHPAIVFGDKAYCGFVLLS